MKNVVDRKIDELNYQHMLTYFLFLLIAIHLILSIKLPLRAHISNVPNPMP